MANEAVRVCDGKLTPHARPRCSCKQVIGWLHRLQRRAIEFARSLQRKTKRVVSCCRCSCRWRCCRRCCCCREPTSDSALEPHRANTAAFRRSSVPLTEFVDAYEQYCGTHGYVPKRVDEHAKLMRQGFGVTIESREAKGYSGVRWRDVKHERPAHGAWLSSPPCKPCAPTVLPRALWRRATCVCVQA